MPETHQPGPSGRFWRFWQNLWGQDPDLRLETRWQKFMAFWGLHVPPPGRQDRLHIRPRFFKVVGAVPSPCRSSSWALPTRSAPRPSCATSATS